METTLTKKKDIFAYLQSKIKSKVLVNEPLKFHTTFKIGGPAEYFIYVENQVDLKVILKLAYAEKIPIFILGNGSNLLINDQGIKGFVLKLVGDFQKFKIIDNKVISASGVSLIKLAKIVSKQGLAGLELLSGIPASLGGALLMNAGVPEQEIGKLVKSVTIMDRLGEIKVLKNLNFNYRSSDLKKMNSIILEAELELKKGNPELIKQKMQENILNKKKEQPLKFFNAGSIFKNPKGQKAWKIIENLKLKGFSIGGAKISQKHSNFIINYNKATATEVLKIIQIIQKKAWENYKIKLELEIKII